MGRIATLPRAELERLRGWLPHVVRAEGLTEWERTFVVSCLAQANRNPAWLPTARQAPVLARIVAAFQAATLREDDGVVEAVRE